MPETESDYPQPPEEELNYGDSWRPEDKAAESAEIEALTEHTDPAQKTDDADIDPDSENN